MTTTDSDAAARPRSVAQLTEVAYGWTMDDVNRCAAVAVKRANGGLVDYVDRFEAAWHAIVVYLLEAKHAPTWNEMNYEGRRAVGREVDLFEKTHGWNRHDHQERPSFGIYWRGKDAGTADDFSSRIVDSMALQQMLDSLPEAQYAAVVMLAALGNQRLAAEKSGLSLGTYLGNLRKAREVAKAEWFAPEHPPVPPDPKLFCKRGHPREKWAYLNNAGATCCRRCASMFRATNTRRNRPWRDVEDDFDEAA